MRAGNSKAVRLAGSYFITTCATLAAIILFVGIGSQLLPGIFAAVPMPDSASTLKVAFLLNIAIILLGWRRARDLRDTVDALEQAEREAHRNANIDHTTGLANRREFIRCISEMIDGRRKGILLLVDLDHFKRVNDLHGHSAGDRLLSAVAEILTATAPGGACCARIGGDEFAMLLPGASPADAEQVAARLLESFREPITLGGLAARVSASIGLAALDPALDQAAALRRSDVALYAAKNAGRNGFAWFNDELGDELARRLALDEDIRRGIEQGEFVPFFQPVVDLKTREIAGFEALARWRSPTRGLLEPESFIEQAEATGLIGPLTLSVMEQALTEAKHWPAHLKIAVNISPIQFRDPALAQEIVKILTLTGFPARRLELEITEGALLEDRKQVIATIESLKALGVRISLDDFGTGYASLSQLDTLPVDRIKIDRSFITRFVKSQRTAAIVDAIASLGHKLNVPLTAEGVESEQIRNQLGTLGCSEAQGWLYGRAVSADTVASFLNIDPAADGEGESAAPEQPRKRLPGAKF